MVVFVIIVAVADDNIEDEENCGVVAVVVSFDVPIEVIDAMLDLLVLDATVIEVVGDFDVRVKVIIVGVSDVVVVVVKFNFSVNVTVEILDAVEPVVFGAIVTVDTIVSVYILVVFDVVVEFIVVLDFSVDVLEKVVGIVVLDIIDLEVIEVIGEFEVV